MEGPSLLWRLKASGYSEDSNRSALTRTSDLECVLKRRRLTLVLDSEWSQQAQEPIVAVRGHPRDTEGVKSGRTDRLSPQDRPDQQFLNSWALEPLHLLKITDDIQDIFFRCILSIGIYHIRNKNQKVFKIFH